MLTQHAARPDSPVLTQAAAEVRAALREITIDGSTAAAPEVIAARVNLTSLAGTLATVLSWSTDLAHVVHDVVTDPAVTFPARAVNQPPSLEAPTPAATASRAATPRTSTSRTSP